MREYTDLFSGCSLNGTHNIEQEHVILVKEILLINYHAMMQGTPGILQ